MRRGRAANASQYSLQLREKQKVKRLYGLLERQFSNLMEEASRTPGPVRPGAAATIWNNGPITLFTGPVSRPAAGPPASWSPTATSCLTAAASTYRPSA